MLIPTGVVLHLSEASADKHRAVLRNALNLLPEVERGTPIELVVHGEAICLALPGQVTANALTEALDAGIILVVCRNSMRSQNLNDEDLIPGAVTVASAVGHLVARQGQGWAYLRP
jgi:intracellular sulfur oxidation DsrE/DsrF family protein